MKNDFNFFDVAIVVFGRIMDFLFVNKRFCTRM